MGKCPNCGQSASRTEDWACQWCGYPLLSRSYEKMPKTYQQLKGEKLHRQKSSVREGDKAPLPPNYGPLAPHTLKNGRKPIAGPEAEPMPAIELTVDELLSAFEASEVAADAKFMNAVLGLTGVVDRIVVKDAFDIRYILLTGAGENNVKSMWKVQCAFDKRHAGKLNQLTTGQTVTVRGKYDGYVGNILMRDCVFIA